MTRADRYLAIIQKLQIRTANQRVQPLKLNDAQQKLWAIVADRLNAKKKCWLIVLKARQEGVSTLTEAMLLTRLMTEEHVRATVTAHEAEATRTIWEMAKFMVEHSAFRHVAKPIGTRLLAGTSYMTIATAGSPDAVRSSNNTCFHGSEVAFWPHPDALLATLQTLPSDHETLCVLESTANGKVGIGALFYDEWTRAVEGKSDFVPVFLPWFQLPKYELPECACEDKDAEELALVQQFGLSDGQLAWRRFMIANYCQGDVEKFHQEYPATAEEAFIQSGLPFFRTKDLLFCEASMRDGQRVTMDLIGVPKNDPQGPIEIWQRPEKGHSYVIGADSSMGFDDVSRSRSAACVLDMDTLEQVAELDAAVPPHVFAKYLTGLGRYYNMALLAPEVQGSGGGGGREILIFLQEHGYHNLHRWRIPDRVSKQPTALYGWETNARTRPRMLARIREVVMEQSVKLHSRKLLKQLASFGENDEGRMAALAGHDDLLFAFGIALMSRSENFVAKHPVTDKKAEIDWKSLGIRVQTWPANIAEAHLAMIGKGTEKDKSYLEY